MTMGPCALCKPLCRYGTRAFLLGGEYLLALLRKQKEQLLAGYSERVERAQVMIWSEYTGVTVQQVSDLRGRLRPVGAEGVVVKNTLMRMALEKAGFPIDQEMMANSCLVTFVYDDIAAAAKAVSDFARENGDHFQIKGAVMDSTVMDASGVRSLTTMPSRDQLLAQVVGGIGAPITGLVGTLAAVMRGLVNVLNAYSEQLEGSAN